MYGLAVNLISLSGHLSNIDEIQQYANDLFLNISADVVKNETNLL